ncbi:MAG: SAVED domain-containing protein, partial [Myxococcales bacterium]|nr:SAVED domain-containing protein [Myxococcales bacterium]
MFDEILALPERPGEPDAPGLAELLVAWLMRPGGLPDERRRRQATATELQAAINRAELGQPDSARTLLAEALKSWHLELPAAPPATPSRELRVVLDVFGSPPLDEWTGAGPTTEVESIHHSGHRDRREPIDPRGPLDWPSLADATEATVAQLRERLAGTEPTRLIVTGLAPLPVFVHLGLALSAWSQPTVLLNRRGTGAWDTLPIDGQLSGMPFFDIVRGLDQADPSEALGRVAVFVAPAGYLLSLSAVRTYLGEQGERLAGLVEITSSQETLTAENANAASAELLQAMRAIRAAYPRAHGIALFVAGPSTLAFLTGRALNPNVLGTIDVPQFQAGRYVPALMLPWLGGRAAAPSPQASLSLDRLRLRDFRGIRDAEIELHPESSVFIGLNGAGKTSVLDAMSLMLAQLIEPIVARATERQGDKSPTRQRLAFDDIRIGADEATIEAVIRWDERRSQWSIQRRRDENSPSVHKASPALKQAIDALDRLSATEDAGLPIAVYYSVNRADPDIPQRTRSTATSRARRIYGDALLKGQADFRAFFSWFKDCEDDENAARRSNAIYEDPRLAAVRRAIEKMLDGFRRPRIERKPLRMVIDKQDTTLSISQLSDGERSLIALAGDLARRLCE